ncbi:MAG: hypothetical protein V4773_30620 [Verrucomicrobiota bacterium]
MNLQQPRDPWTRLTAAARDVRDERDAAMPYGFATRIAAMALAQERRVVSLFERFALRALGVSCLLALGSLAINYSAITMPSPGAGSVVAHLGGEEFEAEASQDDAVALILDFAD